MFLFIFKICCMLYILFGGLYWLMRVETMGLRGYHQRKIQVGDVVMASYTFKNPFNRTKAVYAQKVKSISGKYILFAGGNTSYDQDYIILTPEEIKELK